MPKNRDDLYVESQSVASSVRDRQSLDEITLKRCFICGWIGCKTEHNLSERSIKFVEKAKVKFGWTFDYSKVDVSLYSVKIKIICSLHGEFEQSPTDHLRSKFACQLCSNQNKKPIAKNIKKLYKCKDE
jgi:hypothetical protein